ncbi:hypothetical protein FE257_006014 [Aspergillus nanangensis]|uniref:Amine oxidase n=1 Tax=Aspergillus nanangensis TaxID=2582783 RepID=A0AAD4CQ51_ASPNN|nr:hypothetical protein FE257_006014 [Aspergillus nanangensis]
MPATHPLAPVTPAEINAAAALIKAQFSPGTLIGFKSITLLEPEKPLVAEYLKAERENLPLPQLPRKAFVVYYLKSTGRPFDANVNLSTCKVEHNAPLGPFLHPNSDGYEIMKIEEAALSDLLVQAEIAKLQLSPDLEIVMDPWGYGSDGNGDEPRLFQCLLYVRPKGKVDANHYAHPLNISPVVDATTFKVIRIDRMPTGVNGAIKEPGKFEMQPESSYLPEDQDLRRDLKPLHVIQPEGASFKISRVGELGQRLEWQKWDFIVGFNQREGMVLYDIHYEGRSVLYRISLSEMSIPYADPRAPFHRKHAFDLGDAGAGTMANNLKLGCDCLGSIHYISGVLADDKGDPFDMPNVVCVHEQDNGIGWKHTNYRTGRAAIVRNRELVLQSILTVSNYEYILAFIFNQAGEISYEVRATGILSTQPIDLGVSVPFGTVVHPGVLAAHHQHFFSLRIDPAIDGHCNRLTYTDVEPYPHDEYFNPHGVGYRSFNTVVEKSGPLDLDISRNRVFKIENEHRRNPINGLPVGYKIQVPDFQKILAAEGSFHHRRSEFADHNLYVTRYREGELWAGGQYTFQSRGGNGVRSYAARKDAIVDEDIVIWVSFGINHIPRVEDFPVMPVEMLRVHLKPVNFFTKNPALDVPPSSQAVNRSELLTCDDKAADSCCIKSRGSPRL